MKIYASKTIDNESLKNSIFHLCNAAASAKNIRRSRLKILRITLKQTKFRPIEYSAYVLFNFLGYNGTIVLNNVPMDTYIPEDYWDSSYLYELTSMLNDPAEVRTAILAKFNDFREMVNRVAAEHDNKITFRCEIFDDLNTIDYTKLDDTSVSFEAYIQEINIPGYSFSSADAGNSLFWDCRQDGSEYYAEFGADELSIELDLDTFEYDMYDMEAAEQSLNEIYSELDEFLNNLSRVGEYIQISKDFAVHVTDTIGAGTEYPVDINLPHLVIDVDNDTTRCIDTMPRLYFKAYVNRSVFAEGYIYDVFSEYELSESYDSINRQYLNYIEELKKRKASEQRKRETLNNPKKQKEHQTTINPLVYEAPDLNDYKDEE